MCALSINDENKNDLAIDDNMMENIISLLKNTDPRCLRQAMCCLANLSESHHSHPYLRRHKIHGLVLHHFNNTDVGLVRELSRLLTNLTAVYENHPLLISVGIIEYLTKGCTKNDALITRFCTLGIMNLSTLIENHKDIMFNKSYNILSDIASNATRIWTLLVLFRINC